MLNFLHALNFPYFLYLLPPPQKKILLYQYLQNDMKKKPKWIKFIAYETSFVFTHTGYRDEENKSNDEMNEDDTWRNRNVI